MVQDVRQSILPDRNLPPAAQAWGAAIEKRIEALTSQATGFQTKAASATVWAPLISRIDALDAAVQDAAVLAQAGQTNAIDSVTWSEYRPVSPAEDGSVAAPDTPSNPDSTWFVYEGTKDNVKEVWRWLEPSYEPGDFVGEWVQQKWGTDTLGEGAVDLKNLSASLSSDVITARNAVDALQKRADQADVQYREALAKAEEALAAVNNAGGGSNDGRVIVSDTEPQGADRKSGNLWVNTAGGGAVPFAYDSGTDTWVKVEGEDAAKAAADAVAAKRLAQEALDKAQAQEDLVNAAKLAAERAQESANGKNSIFYTPDKPTLAGRIQGDMWYDVDDGYRMYIYNATLKDFEPLAVSALSQNIQDELNRKLEDLNRELGDKLDDLEAATLAPIAISPYPPDEGVVDKTYWVSKDGRVFIKRKDVQ